MRYMRVPRDLVAIWRALRARILLTSEMNESRSDDDYEAATQDSRSRLFRMMILTSLAKADICDISD